MIPKKLHYCWFGKQPKSKLILDCIESWKHFCPDFEIIEWNEVNSVHYSNHFYKNALRKKKYAFVADYIRTKVLYEHGGIYLDTDMLLLKPIDDFLKYNFFIGEEVESRVAFGMLGCVKQNRFLKQMIHYYTLTEFNVFSPPVITHIFSPLINQKSFQEGELIFSADYFYSLPYESRLETFSEYLTHNSVAVHLWNHSWKATDQNDVKTLVANLTNVVIDFLFYDYSYAYFRRYFKEYSRKIYQNITSKT